MNFETRMVWDAPLDRVMRMLTDRRYFERKLELMAHEHAEILACVQDGSRFSVTTRVMGKPSIKLPTIAQRFIKPDQVVEIEQTDSWDAATATGTLLFINKSVSAVAVSAGMTLTETNGQTENVLKWIVECNVPLVGGKLAEMIANDIRTKAERNQEVSRQILAETF